MGTVSNIKIEPLDVTFGETLAQAQKITCVADVSSSLNNQYFMFYDVDGTKRYAWFNVATAGTDPSVSGATAAPVALSANATSTAVATALAAVLDALSGYTASSDGAVVTLTHVATGYAKAAHDGAATTEFAFEVVSYGDTALDLGYIEGDIEMTLEGQMVEVTSHQTGTDILTHINTGSNVSIGLTLKEVSAANLRKVLLSYGDSHLPTGTGASATEVYGWGSSTQFKQTLNRSRKLYLHPRVLNAADKSRDLTFWKAYVMPDSLTFSGENVQMLPVNFTIYPDLSKNAKIQKFCYGDASQF